MLNILMYAFNTLMYALMYALMHVLMHALMHALICIQYSLREYIYDAICVNTYIMQFV